LEDIKTKYNKNKSRVNKKKIFGRITKFDTINNKNKIKTIKYKLNEKKRCNSATEYVQKKVI